MGLTKPTENITYYGKGINYTINLFEDLNLVIGPDITDYVVYPDGTIDFFFKKSFMKNNNIGLYRYHKKEVSYPYKIILDSNEISFEVLHTSFKSTAAIHIFYSKSWFSIL